MFAGKGIGHDRQRVSDNPRPGNADQDKGQNQHIFIADIGDGEETQRTQRQTGEITVLMELVRHLRQHIRARNRRDGLHRRQHPVPVARFLVTGRSGVCGLPDIGGNRACGIRPQILEGKPAEKLRQ